MSVTREDPLEMTLYRGSSKHKNRPTQERKGTLCPEWTHRTPTGGFANDVYAHDWGTTEAAKLFAAAVIDPSSQKRYATAKGIAFEARPTNDGTWHGFPIPWESVPPSIKNEWLDNGGVSRQAVKKYMRVDQADISWAMETES